MYFLSNLRATSAQGTLICGHLKRGWKSASRILAAKDAVENEQ